MKKSGFIGAVAAAAMAVSAFAAMPVSAETYHAYLGVQEPTGWSFRNAWNEPTYGLGKSSDDGLVYFDHITGWDGSTALNKGGDFTDAEITGDGEYTVSLTGDFDFGDAEKFSLMFVSTDIPLDAGVTFSNVKVKIDGSTKYTFDEGYVSPDDPDYYNIVAINQWNGDLGGDEGLFGYAMPASSVEISFTVSGLDAAAPAEAETEAPAPAETEAPAPAPDTATTSTSTGNIPAAALAALAAAAAAAAVVTAKRK